MYKGKKKENNNFIPHTWALGINSGKCSDPPGLIAAAEGWVKSKTQDQDRQRALWVWHKRDRTTPVRICRAAKRVRRWLTQLDGEWWGKWLRSGVWSCDDPARKDGLPNARTACLVLLVSRQEGWRTGRGWRMSQSKRRRDQGNWHQESKARAAGHFSGRRLKKQVNTLQTVTLTARWQSVLLGPTVWLILVSYIYNVYICICKQTFFCIKEEKWKLREELQEMCGHQHWTPKWLKTGKEIKSLNQVRIQWWTQPLSL